MLLQGDLQRVFDALYHMGVIDPVLEMDWTEEFARIEDNPYALAKLVHVVNDCHGDYRELMENLRDFEQLELSHLAMLVAKELVGFHTNKTVH